MSFEPQDVLDLLASHAASTGYYERVNQHEPKNAPGNGLTCAIWADHLEHVLSSGLDSSSIRVTFKIRIYSKMLQEPQDAIDPEVLRATAALLRAYNGDFELNGLARNIDLLGSDGEPVTAEAGYVEVSKILYRAMDINLHVIFNDVFDQAP